VDYTELSKEFLQAIYRFHKIRPQKQLNEAVHGEAFALQFIAQYDGTVLPGELENAMGVSSARIATVLNGLENKGWITRRIDPTDRRRTLLNLTPAGQAQVAQHTQQLLDIACKILAYLGEEDARHYVRIMSRLAEKHDFDWC